jgi:hypothetical protein
MDRYKKLIKEHEAAIRKFYGERSLKTMVEQRKEFIQKYDKWKESNFKGEKPTITKELWGDFQKNNPYLTKIFEEKSDIINDNIQMGDIGTEGSSVPKGKITHYEIKDIDNIKNYQVTRETIGLDFFNKQLEARQAAAMGYRKYYARVEECRNLGRSIALISAGLALNDYKVTKSLVSNLRHRVKEMVDQDYLATSELTDILDAWHAS